MRCFSCLCVTVFVASACDDASAPRLPLSVAPSTLQLIGGDTARLAASDSRSTVRLRSSAPSRVIPFKCAGAPSISPNNVILAAGDTARVESLPVCSVSLSMWASGDTAVAVVEARGTRGSSSVAVITARRSGTAVVTARNGDDPTESASMAVTVR